jgi:uncharacterized protein YjiS (DUF1127 family)
MALVETTTRRIPGIVTIFHRLVENLSDWQATRSTRKALLKLSEHELEDIGLNRADIDLMRFSRAR